ncbi:MAG: hypothetical protein L6R42_008146 [Xanthoria sp. 1 TBL-2021]|nr:MAG: hypothetical protein L6R42_008146 [Xanthoria sp. 1 TBL-2021]
MFARRLCVFENISKQCAPALRYSQRRWAQVHDVRFLVTHQRADSITERYRDKLLQKAAQEGLQSVDELKTVYKDRIQKQREKATTNAAFPQPPPPPDPTSIAPSSTPSSPPSSKSSAPPGFKTLSSYLDLPKTLTLPPKEIEYIWRLRHANSPTSLCAILPSPTYLRIQQTARKHPHFILPLPREGSTGAEIHFLQWSFPAPDTATVVFTHLAEYKLRGEYSQPHTTITMHLELMDEKGLVLMQGQVLEGRRVNVEEARWLVLCLQKFYGGEEGDHVSRRRLLEKFSQGDETFKVEELVDEAEKIV